MEWLVVHVAGRDLALDLRRVREVLAAVVVTRVPGTAPALLGVAPVRGRPVAVVDLAERLGVRDVPGGGRSPAVVVTARVDGSPVTAALLVDDAGRLASAAEVLPRPGVWDGAPDAALCAGFVLVGGGLVPVLDVDEAVAVPRAGPRARVGTRMRDPLSPTGGEGQGEGAPARDPRPIPEVGVAAPMVRDPLSPTGGEGQGEGAPARDPRPIPKVGGALAAPTVRDPLSPTGGEGQGEGAPARDPRPIPKVGGAARRPPSPRPSPPAARGERGIRSTATANLVPDAVHPERSADAQASARSRRARSWPALLAAAAAAAALLALLRSVAPRGAAPRADAPAPAPLVQRVALSRLEVVHSPPEPARAAPPRVAPQPPNGRHPCPIHGVARGDTLWAIAGRHLGDPHRWPELFAANRDVVADPDLIEPGERIAIPGCPR